MNETLDPTIKNLASAIKRQESAGSKDPYNAKGASGEYGAYQFMPDTWKGWAKTHLGDENAPMTMENQNKVAYNQIKYWKEKKGYNPAQIAAAWNAGEGSLQNDSWKTKVGVNQFGVKYDTPSYVKNVSKYYQELKGNIPAEQDVKSILAGNYQAPETLSGMDGTEEVTPAGLATQFAGSMYNPAVQIGIEAANRVVGPTVNALGGSYEQVKSLPSFENIVGDPNSPRVIAPSYDEQGNPVSLGKEIEKTVGGAGMTALNLASFGKGKAVSEGFQGVGKYAVGKFDGPLSGLVRAGAKEVPFGAGYGASIAMSEGGDAGDVALSTLGGGALGFAGGATLKGVSNQIAKSEGITAKLITDLDTAVQSGDDAKIKAIMESPAYKKLISSNKYDNAAVSESVTKVRKSIEEGIDNSYGVSKLTRTEKAENLTDDGIEAMMEHAQNTNNPIADTKLALENKANDLMDTALNPIIDKVRNEKLPLVPLDRQALLDDFYARLDKSYITDLDKQKIKDYVATLINTQNRGNPFGIVDAGIIRRDANFDFTNPKNKGAVSRMLGNVMRDALNAAEKNATDPQTKAIIAHINAVNKEYSRLMQGVDVVELMARFPGQKPSELLNKAAGFFGAGATGNNPLAYLGAHRLTNTAQKTMLRAKNNALFGDMSGKAGPITSSELIGNTQRILKNVAGVSETRTAQQAAEQATREASIRKNNAVNKLLNTITPKRDADLPVIEMGPKPVSKYATVDPKLPVAKGPPNVYSELSAETKSYMEMYEKNGIKTEPLSSESFGEKDRQKIIDFLNKQPDAVVLAEREKLSNLVEMQKQVVDHLHSSDVPFIIKRLNKLTDKRGEFKGELNLNNAKGARTKNNDVYLREVFNDNDNKYSAEELAGKYYDLKEEYTNAKALLKDLKSKFKNLKSGSLPGFAKDNVVSGLAALSAGGIAAKNIGSKLQEKYGTETYQREPEPVKVQPDNTEVLASQIANAETRGEADPYKTAKWSDRRLGPASPLGKDLGKYQITSARLREKSKEFLGRVVTDEEFLASPELQDKFILAQIKWQKSHGLSDDEILATHRRGWGNMKPEQLKKAVATSSDYLEQARAGK